MAEIESKIGTQFHPAVAKAFIAVQRGQDPYAALTPDEKEELRAAAAPYRVPDITGARDLKERPELIALGGLVAGLAGIGLGQLWLAVLGGALALAGMLLRGWARFRSNRLKNTLAVALADDDRDLVFERLAAVLAGATRSEWIGLVRWEEDGLGGSLELSEGEPPQERALMSWLVREAESRDELLTAPAHEVGDGDGAYVALPLRRENSTLVGFVVLRTPRALQRHVRTALFGSLDALGLALATRPQERREPVRAAAAS